MGKAHSQSLSPVLTGADVLGVVGLDEHGSGCNII